QNVASVKKHAFIQGGALIADLLGQHLRHFVEGKCSVCSAGIAEARCLQTNLAAVIASVSSGCKVGEAVFLEQGGVHGISLPSVLTRLDCARDLPSSELFGEKRSRDNVCRKNGTSQKQRQS